MNAPHPLLNVLTGPRPPRYDARYDQVRRRWLVYEDGRPVNTFRRLATRQEALDEVARLATHRFAVVGTFALWPETEVQGALDRWISIPPPPAHMFAGPERGLVILGRLKLN